jgi:hypothetical protein
MAAVVVFPCAPATTIERCNETSSARNSARGLPSTSVAIRGRDDDLVPAVRDDRLGRELYQRPPKRSQVGRLDPVPPAHLRAPGASKQRIPGKARRRRSDEPDRRPSRGGKRHQLLAISGSRTGRAIASIARLMRSRRRSSARSSSTSAGDAIELGLGDDDRARPRPRAAGVLRLVVGGRSADTERGRPAARPPRSSQTEPPHGPGPGRPRRRPRRSRP